MMEFILMYYHILYCWDIKHCALLKARFIERRKWQYQNDKKARVMMHYVESFYSHILFYTINPKIHKRTPCKIDYLNRMTINDCHHHILKDRIHFLSHAFQGCARHQKYFMYIMEQNIIWLLSKFQKQTCSDTCLPKY